LTTSNPTVALTDFLPLYQDSWNFLVHLFFKKGIYGVLI
jgi:hypothetical protein